jgi:hypothetical protein
VLGSFFGGFLVCVEEFSKASFFSACVESVKDYFCSRFMVVFDNFIVFLFFLYLHFPMCYNLPNIPTLPLMTCDVGMLGKL